MSTTTKNQEVFNTEQEKKDNGTPKELTAKERIQNRINAFASAETELGISSFQADDPDIVESSRGSLGEKCNALQGTLTALQKSPILKTGANISKSKGVRTCLYANELEFKNEACRTAFKRAGEEIRASRSGNESGIRSLIEELGQSGACPKTLSLLQGNGTGVTKPLLTLKRSADASPNSDLKNVLNDYINVQYHINFSMVPERDARRLQSQMGRETSKTGSEDVDSLTQKIRKSGTVSLASTGETARNAISEIEEEDARDTVIERVDEALFKQADAGKIQSNLAELASIWNKTGNFTEILDTGRFAKLSKETARLTVQNRVTREESLANMINELQRGTLQETNRQKVDVSDRNYYNIKSLKINNVHGPTYEDPFISNLISMEMVLVEPHGLKLNEDLVNLAAKLGYNTVNPGRVLYKVDVWFSGYDPESGYWENNIPIAGDSASKKQMISYYVVLTGMEANMNVVGTEYKVTLVPQGFMATRPEEFSLEGTTIPTGENPTFGSFLKNLSDALSKKRKDETKEALGGAGLHRIYKFYAPDAIMNAPFYQGDFLQRNNLVDEDPKKGMFITIGKDVDILTLLRSALSDLPEVQTAFLTGNENADFVKPVTHFTVRFNTKYVAKRPEIYDYDGIVYEFIIEPFLTFKKLGFDANTIKNYTKPESQAARVTRMLNLGMVKRVYNYINTAENTDVLNFDIKLNNFYYESFRRSFDPGARKGKQTAAQPAKVESASNLLGLKRELEVNLVLNEDPQVKKRYQPAEESSLQRLFGKGEDKLDGDGRQHHDGDTSQVSANRVLQGGLGTTNDPVSYGSTSSDGNVTKTKDEYLYRFNDHFSLDLMTLEGLELRGDPIWLMTPYATVNNNSLISMAGMSPEGEVITGVLQPHTEKVIFLNIKDTKQFAYMDSDRYNQEIKTNPTIMAGFYGIFGSESVFENGTFIQSLKGYKMAHLNYVGEQMNIEKLTTAAGDPEPSGVSDKMSASEWVSQVLDQASNLPEFSTEMSAFRERERLKKKKSGEYIK